MNKDKFYILLISLFLGIVSFFLSGTVFLFLVFGVISYLIYKNASPEDRRFILTVLVTGFLLRVILAFALHALSYTKGYEGFTSGDDMLYSLRSWSLVFKWEGKPYIWQRTFAPSPGYGLNPFTYLLAFFYKLFGFHPATAKIINCIIGTLIGWMSYLMGKEMFDNKAAKISMLIVTFYPSLVRWSVANLKDPLIILLFMICAHILIVRLNHKIKVIQLITLAVSMAILYHFVNKFYFILIVIGIGLLIFFRFLDLFKKKKLKIFILSIVCLAILGSGYYFLYVKPDNVLQFIYMTEYFQKGAARSDYAGYYLYTRDFMDSVNKGIIPPLEFCNVIFKNIVYFMLTPFPWNMSSRGQLSAYPQMLIWYLLLILSIFGFSTLFIKKPKIAFLLAILLIVGITVRSFVEGNIGAAFRHRDIYTPFFIIFASLTIRNLMDKKTL